MLECWEVKEMQFNILEVCDKTKKTKLTSTVGTIKFCEKCDVMLYQIVFIKFVEN